MYNGKRETMEAGGHWQRAAEAVIVDGTGPDRPVKRDEVIAVLGRKWLLD